MGFSFRLSRKWRERVGHWGRVIASYVTYPWFMLVGAFSWCSALLSRAWSTRHFRYFIQGFPALFGAAALVIAGVFVANSFSQERRANLAKDYLEQAGYELRKAVTFEPDKDLTKRDEHFAVARTYVEKALSLEGGDRDDLKFELAKILDQMGKHTEFLGPAAGRSAEQNEVFRRKLEYTEHSRAIMLKLAPDNKNGYAPAHLWRGQYYAAHFALEPVVIAIMENQFTRAYEIARNERDELNERVAAYCLATLYVGQRRFSEAVPLLEKIEEKYPVQRLVLGGVYEAMNRPADAQKMYLSAERYFGTKSTEKVDDKESRLQWARSLMAQKKYDKAVEVLYRGTVATRDSRFLFDVAEAYRLWELQLAQDPKSKLNERLGLVQKGIQAFPGSVQLLARLHMFSTMKGPEGEEADKQVKQMLQEGKQEPILYFIMGSYEYRQGLKDLARKHWEIAYAMDPNFSWIGNNLALMIAVDEKNPDPNKALDMIEKVIAQYPNQPNFYGTRGQIRVKLKMFDDALPDLKKGLQAQANDLGLNEAIAEAYEATGDRTLAEVHRKKIVEIKEAQAKERFDPNAPVIPADLEIPKPGDTNPPLPKDRPTIKPPMS